MPTMSSLGGLNYPHSPTPYYYIGKFTDGGYYIGDWEGYRLILQPRLASPPLLAWSTVTGTTGVRGNNGLNNTNALMAIAPNNYPAAKYCYNLNLNGYSDWFLPSQQQLGYICVPTTQSVLYSLPSPTSDNYGQFPTLVTWTSEESLLNPVLEAEDRFFTGYLNCQGNKNDKLQQLSVRAMRLGPLVE